MTDVALLPCESLLALYRVRKLSPVELLAAVVRRIEKQNKTINAFAHLDLESAQVSARESETRWMAGRPLGVLDGLPISVKDLALTSGMPTLRGSLCIDRSGPWEQDAPAVARAREQGAVLVGKTAVPEFGCKGTTDSRIGGVTRNPWNVQMTPGGSSGGAVAAVASGMSCADIASDAGGSIRFPAALAGVVGVKPSFGRIPDYPPSPHGSMAVIGPICRTVRDAALLMNVLSRPDPRDPACTMRRPEDFTARIEEDLGELAIAFSPTLGYARVEDGILEVCERAIGQLTSQVGTIDRLDKAFADPGALVGLFLSVGLSRLYRGLDPKRVKDSPMDPVFVGAVRRGEQTTLNDYLDAVAARRRFISEVDRLFRRYDVLITPTLPIPAFPVGSDDPPAGRFACEKQWKPFSGWVNLAKIPAVSVPCGITREGLPVGLQIAGPRFSEATVLRVARALERVCGFVLPDLAAKIQDSTSRSASRA